MSLLFTKSNIFMKMSPLSCTISRSNNIIQEMVSNGFHTNNTYFSKKNERTSAIAVNIFEGVHKKQKDTFLEAVRMYEQNNEMRRGHVEFIRAALKYMDDFNVNCDLETYKKLLNVLPKRKFIPTNKFQTMFRHYPAQQDVAVELLDKMEHNQVIPDREMESILLNIFGLHGGPLKKYWRMMYWMPKFKNLNPWPVPKPIPTDPRELARLAIYKISSIDMQIKIEEFETETVEDCIDKTWIVSAISPLQQEILQLRDNKQPLYVEGPFAVYVADKSVDYFVLRGSPCERMWPQQTDTDEVENIQIPFWEKSEIALPRTIHEQEDGTYISMCATGTSSKDSLLSWIRCLQKENPILGNTPIVFKLVSSTNIPEKIESNEVQAIKEN